MSALAEATEDGMRRAIDRLDFASVRRTFDEQDQFVFLRDVFPEELIESFRGTALGLSSRVVRNHVPLVRKGGFVGHQTLRESAPEIVTAYQSRALIDFLSRLCGKQLFIKAESDPHACVLYYYTEPGDHLGYHYDTCGCEKGASYTALLGLVNDSTQVLHCKIFREDRSKKTRHIPVRTIPGSLITFNGSSVYHRVSRLGRGERRIVLSLSYRTDQEMTKVSRFMETLKDRALFIGVPDFFARKHDS